MRPAHSARQVAMLVALSLTAACAAQDAPVQPAASMASIQALIGDAGCQSDAQCKTIAVGAKACGGPQAYLAWSTARTDDYALKRAADDYAAERQREIRARGEVSTCTFLADPGAYCAAPNAVVSGRAGVCRLRSASPGSSNLVR
jgi:hypothetical protein